MKVEKTDNGSLKHTGERTEIVVHIDSARRNEDGTWSLFIPTRPLSIDEQKVLTRLFPNTVKSVYRLLAQECLLGSIAE